jgi:hypothetical protein
MPTGSNERTPADAERPPVSRVGDELQQRADDDADPAQAEQEALDEARRKGWDKEATNQA